MPAVVVRITVVGALLLMAGVPAAAQSVTPPDEFELGRLLVSDDPREQAWAAWWTGRLGAAEAADSLLQNAERALVDHELWPQGMVIDVTLDALIELDARPRLDFLERVRLVRPSAAMILLSRMGDAANVLLLSIMRNAEGYEWHAAANLLYQRKAPGFAAELLSGLELTAHVTVSAEGPVPVFGVGRGIGIGCGGMGVADGYPPWTGYAFRSCSQTGEVFIARGPTPVCYERARAAAGSIGTLSVHVRSGPSHHDRLSFFSSLAPELGDIEYRGARFGADALKLAMDDAITTLRRNYQQLVRQLTDLAWLTPEEARQIAQPTIREVVVRY